MRINLIAAPAGALTAIGMRLPQNAPRLLSPPPHPRALPGTR